ncbi:MAG: fumarylacetoacetate hydrolase family protein [Cryobacterium sp.]|nr:fumarylacetoacetate hydrolase family protein [Oligoflexia bacterium]
MHSPFRTPVGLSFPVRNIFCVGRNYREHAKELGNEVPSEPVIFTKPTSALCLGNEPIVLPPHSSDVHYELEIVVAIGRRVKNESATEVLSALQAVAVGIDVTARDLQNQLKQKKLPWTLAKGLDTFAALSPFIEVEKPSEKDWGILTFELAIDGQNRQSGKTSEMIFSIPTLVSYLSHRFTLDRGDIIYTGTPSGVGPLKPGNRLKTTWNAFGTSLTWETRVTTDKTQQN